MNDPIFHLPYWFIRKYWKVLEYNNVEFNPQGASFKINFYLWSISLIFSASKHIFQQLKIFFQILCKVLNWHLSTFCCASFSYYDTHRYKTFILPCCFGLGPPKTSLTTDQAFWNKSQVFIAKIRDLEGLIPPRDCVIANSLYLCAKDEPGHLVESIKALIEFSEGYNRNYRKHGGNHHEIRYMHGQLLSWIYRRP